MITKCGSCGAELLAPEVGSGIECKCGQMVFHNPQGHDNKPYIDGGIHNRCMGCGELIRGSIVVSYTQYAHDHCYIKKLSIDVLKNWVEGGWFLPKDRDFAAAELKSMMLSECA